MKISQVHERRNPAPNPWDNFRFTVINGTYNNGMIRFNRKNISATSHDIFIKVQSKKGGASDSISINIPYISAIKVRPIDKAVICPGFDLPLQIDVLYNNGAMKSYIPNSKADVKASDFTVKIDGNTINEPFSEPLPLFKGFYSEVKVECFHNSIPSLRDTVTITLQFDGHYKYSFNGHHGSDGQEGDWGRGKTELNGRDGRPGQNGQHGSRAPWVSIYLQSFHHEDRILLKAFIKSSEQSYYGIFDPNKGLLEVSTNGGRGGRAVKVV